MKSELRKTLLATRRAMSENDLSLKSDAILKRLQDSGLVDRPEVVMCYMDFRNEVQTSEIMNYLWSLGKTVVLPRVNPNTKTLDLYAVEGFKDLVTGSMGILEPMTSLNLLLPEDIDLVLAPGVAFDLKGYRMGYGGGFYDKLIPTLRDDCLVIALAFELQVVETLPAEAHDMPMNGILTEERLLLF